MVPLEVGFELAVASLPVGLELATGRLLVLADVTRLEVTPVLEAAVDVGLLLSATAFVRVVEVTLVDGLVEAKGALAVGGRDIAVLVGVVWLLLAVGCALAFVELVVDVGCRRVDWLRALT